MATTGSSEKKEFIGFLFLNAVLLSAVVVWALLVLDAQGGTGEADYSWCYKEQCGAMRSDWTGSEKTGLVSWLFLNTANATGSETGTVAPKPWVAEVIRNGRG